MKRGTRSPIQELKSQSRFSGSEKQEKSHTNGDIINGQGVVVRLVRNTVLTPLDGGSEASCLGIEQRNEESVSGLNRDRHLEVCGFWLREEGSKREVDAGDASRVISLYQKRLCSYH